MTLIVSCPNCGQKNKIDITVMPAKNRPICAKCWTELPLSQKTDSYNNQQANSQQHEIPHPPPEAPRKTSVDEKKGSSGGWDLWTWLGVLFFGFIGYAVFFSDSDSSGRAKSKTSYSTSQSSRPSYPEVTRPYSGTVQTFTSASRIAPLTIQTQSGIDYLLKLEDAYTGNQVLSVFISGGRTESIDVPLGNFRIKYATGRNWYGYKYLFGPDTGYNKANTTFEFKNTGYQITGYTLTLYSVSNGNLSTSRIGAEAF